MGVGHLVSLLVIFIREAEDVSSPFVGDGVSGDLLRRRYDCDNPG